MKRLAILAGTLGVVVLAGVAGAQSASAPAAQPPSKVGPAFVDADGDGICDNCTGAGQRKGHSARRGKGSGAGPGDGTGNQRMRPRDGSGYGRTSGAGTCNGSGPRGRGRSGR